MNELNASVLSHIDSPNPISLVAARAKVGPGTFVNSARVHSLYTLHRNVTMSHQNAMLHSTAVWITIDRSVRH